MRHKQLLAPARFRTLAYDLYELSFRFRYRFTVSFPPFLFKIKYNTFQFRFT